MSNHVFVLDTSRKPLTPCTPGMARSLLKAGKAAVLRRYPFTIILHKEVNDAPTQPCQLKIDPGSKTTGLAILKGEAVLWGAELQHRGQAIKASLLSRHQLRRGRRHRKTRYRRPPKHEWFRKGKQQPVAKHRREGWLPPSLRHRVETTLTWVHRLIRFCAIDSLAQELVHFDTQKLQNPEVSGVEYQQGELAGYEVREYLLEKWGRQCVYCSTSDTPLEVEHIQAKSKGGSNRVSNLTLACHPCNQAKGNRDLRDFLSGKPDLAARILKQAKAPLRDAAAVNATRWALFNALKDTGLPVTVGTGGRTKFNRKRFGIQKAHWLDAACVGKIDGIQLCTKQPLLISATGHGKRQMCGTDKFGFPNRHRTGQTVHFGFKTGNIIRAAVPKGKKAGVHKGRVLCRKTGSFDIQTGAGRVTGVNHKYCQNLHQKDGYAYSFC